MAIRGQALTVTFLVWNTATNEPVADDAANLTMRIITDSVAAAATNAPAAVENGEHSLVVTDDEMDGGFVTVEGSSTTANVIVVPLHITPEVLTTGLGDNTVTLTLNDGDGDPVMGISCVVRNNAETAVVAREVTDADGQIEIQLDDGSYQVRYGPSAAYSFSNPYALTVSGNTTATFTCVALTVPVAVAGTLCTCWIDIYYTVGALAGQLVGENLGSVEVNSISPHWSTDEAVPVLARGDTNPVFQTNATGRASFDAVRGAELRLKVTRPGGVDTITITVPDQASYYIPLAGAER